MDTGEFVVNGSADSSAFTVDSGTIIGGEGSICSLALSVGATSYEFVQGSIPANPPVNAFADTTATNTLRQFYLVEVE